MEKNTALVILAIIATIIVVAVYAATRSQSFSAAPMIFQRPLALSVWWSTPDSAPAWAAYNFNFAVASPTVPAICSAVVRIVRDGRVQKALFVGTGNEHHNMLLYATDSGTGLMNCAARTGLTYLPNPTLSVYSVVALVDNGKPTDDLLIGRSDGIWHLRSAGSGVMSFGSATTTYFPTRIVVGSGNLPVAMSVSAPVDKCDIDKSATYMNITADVPAKIWSSFVVAPSSLRVKSSSRGTYAVPLPTSLSTTFDMLGKTSIQWYGRDGRFGAGGPPPSNGSGPFQLSTYEWTAGACWPCELQFGGAPMQVAKPRPVDFSNFGGELGPDPHDDRAKLTDTMSLSTHITMRPGATDSDGLSRPSEQGNDLVKRSERATANRALDRNLAAAGTSKTMRLVMLFSSPFNAMNCGTVLRSDLVRYLAGGRNRVKLLVAAPVLGNATVVLSGSTDTDAVVHLTAPKHQIARVKTYGRVWESKPLLQIGPYSFNLDLMDGLLEMQPIIALI